MSYANNKGADQPVHPRSLNSTFVFRCLDSIIHVPLVSILAISCLQLVSVAEQTGLSHIYLVENPEDMFSCDEAQIRVGLQWFTYLLYKPKVPAPVFGMRL